MERDLRRDRGQWRGCYSFKDIVCDGDAPASPRRNGGLKMGETYYYYYEVDGATETHDPSLPSTTACPYLPGQTVNTMWVPVEQSERKRSASLSSVRDRDFKTMNPADKFTTPRPPPPLPGSLGVRLGTSPSPMSLSHKRSARSLSPNPNWSWSPRKLFKRKARSLSSREGDHDRQADEETRSMYSSDDQRSTTPSERSRTRDISPESLRRFLSDDIPIVAETTEPADRPTISIPEDIVEEHEDDENDENFATSAASESTPPTVLSPPPFKRAFSSGTIVQLASSEKAVGETAEDEGEQATPVEAPTRPPPEVPGEPTLEVDIPRSHFSFSSGSSLHSHVSPQSPDDLPSFYHSEDEDEDLLSSLDGETFPFPPLQGLARKSLEQSIAAAFEGYRLPRSSVDGEDKGPGGSRSQPPGLASPAFVARSDSESVPVGNTGLLVGPSLSGLDDLVTDLGWMADVIHGKGA